MNDPMILNSYESYGLNGSIRLILGREKQPYKYLRAK